VSRVLVTGAEGFVGRRLVQRLAATGAHALTLVDRALPAAREEARRIQGDIADTAVLAAAIEAPPDLVFHLASLPGGAAEADPKASRRVNLDATLNLFEAAADTGRRARVVYASSIAVFGAPLPPAVDDYTPAEPTLTYGAHKRIGEIALADWSRRGVLDGISLRLPGIVARPRQGAGFRSAFMSEIFHALAAGETYELPVGPDATVWAMSLSRCVENLLHAGLMTTPGEGRALTLPAVRARMDALVAAIAAEAGVSHDLVNYAPDAALQAQFGSQPPLSTPAAEALGFRHDGGLEALVQAVLDDPDVRHKEPHP
jgi:D-erythronate 2-dehydrogenase